jgi:cysteine synthase A
MSVERRALIRQFGAELVLTPAEQGIKGSMAKAEEIHAATPNSFIPQQFENAANPAIHERTTAEEIWRDTAGQVDIVVGGVGTGGTITGIGRALKPRKEGLKIVAVQPAESPMLDGGAAGKHGIQGIMPGFVAKNYDASVIDEVISVPTADAIAASQELARTEGVNTGISSGAALAAGAILAARPENAGKNIVVILPDTCERYLSTALFPKVDE